MHDGNVVGYKKGSKGSVGSEYTLRSDIVCTVENNFPIQWVLLKIGNTFT